MVQLDRETHVQLRKSASRLPVCLSSAFVLLALGAHGVGCSGGGSSNRGGQASTTAPSTSSTPSSTTSGSSGPATTSTSSTAPTPTPPVAAAPRQPAAGAWYTGDLHSHSATHSDDARRQLGDPIDVTVRLAEATGLDFLAGTDHRTNAVITDTRFSSQTMVLLPGMEWGGSMHAGAIGLTAPIQVNSTQSGAGLTPEIDTIIDAIHQQGGIFVLNHPCDPGKLWVANPTSPDAIEVWNSQWSWREFSAATQQDLDSKMSGAGLTQAGVAPNPHMVDAIADQRGSSSLQALTFYESYLNAGRRVAAVGGGDRHMLLRQGSPTTHVYAATRTRTGVLDGIRAGRTYISRTPTGPLVSFRADDDLDGTYETLIGDELTPATATRFRVVIEKAQGGRVDVIKRGVVIKSEPILGATFTLTFDDTPAPGDWYRVDVYEVIDPQVQNTLGNLLLVAQASGKAWAVIGAVAGFLPGSAFDYTLGTLIPVMNIPDQVDRVLNASLKDPGYCRGAITSPIYTKP
jgi:hypothetical protein